jgi:hypothetical protein
MTPKRALYHNESKLQSKNVIYDGLSIPEGLEMVINWMKGDPKFQTVIDFEANYVVLRRKYHCILWSEWGKR